jgi:hypothetical protein
MPVHHAFYENLLTTDPNDCTTVVQPIGSAELDLLADRILANGFVLANADIPALLESSVTTVLVKEGYGVNYGGLCDLATTGAAVQSVTSFQKNEPGELVWLNPASGPLPAGNYRLEVRSRLGTTEPRKGQLGAVLTRA